MGRSPCCEKAHTNKGAWTKEEDLRLIHYIRLHGQGCWRSLPQAAGLFRCGKSCRLRWINYLRPDLKRGCFTHDEDQLIIKLHSFLGNKWSLIAGKLPGRTDNEIKNYWNTHIKRKLISRGLDPQTHRPLESYPSVGGSPDGKRSPSQLELFKITNNPPISQTTDFKKGCLDSNNSKSRSDSLQGGTCDSGTTDDGERRRHYAGEIDLELSIGLSSFRVRSNSMASSAESNTSPFGMVQGVAGSSPEKKALGEEGVCSFCGLGLIRNEKMNDGQWCSNCRSTGGFFRRSMLGNLKEEY